MSDIATMEPPATPAATGFDPDAYLAATPTPAGEFNPDAYLQQKAAAPAAPTPNNFDPDAWIQQKTAKPDGLLTPGWLADAAKRGYKGVADDVLQGIRGMGATTGASLAATQKAADETGQEEEGDAAALAGAGTVALGQIAKWAQAKIKSWLPTNPANDRSAPMQAAEGLQRLGAGVAHAAVDPVGTGLLFAYGTGQHAAERAQAAGASPEQVYEARQLGLALGAATATVPLNKLTSLLSGARFNPYVQKIADGLVVELQNPDVRKQLLNVGLEALKTGTLTSAAAAAQQAGENAIAQTHGEPGQAIGEGVPTAAAYGFVGGAAGGALAAAEGTRTVAKTIDAKRATPPRPKTQIEDGMTGTGGETGAETPSEPPSPAQEQFESQAATLDLVRGNPTVVIGAKGTEFPATYAWAPAGLIEPSHTGTQMGANPDYPLTNTRDYADPAEQEKALQTRNTWDPRRAITDSPDASVGPPMVARVIDADGKATLAVVGGNNRQWAMDNLPDEKRAETLALSNAKAQQFGLGPTENADHQLVRFLGTYDFRKPGQEAALQGMVDALNPSPGMVQSSAKRAEIDAQAVPPEKLAGLSMDLSPADAQTEVKRLIEDGTLDRNRSAAIAAHPAQAQDYVQRLLVNAAFQEPAIAEARGDSRGGNATMRGLIDAATPALLQLRHAGPEGGQIAGSIARAFATVLDATKARGIDSLPQALQMAAQQTELDPVHAPAQAIAARLAGAVVTDAKGRLQSEPTIENARAVFAGIARAVAHHSPEPDLFGESRSMAETVAAGAQAPAAGDLTAQETGRTFDRGTEPAQGPALKLTLPPRAEPYLDAKAVTAPVRRAELAKSLTAVYTAAQNELFRQTSYSAAADSGGRGGDGAGDGGRNDAVVRAGILARLGTVKPPTGAEIHRAFVAGRVVSSVLADLIADPRLGYDLAGAKVENSAQYAALKMALRSPAYEVSTFDLLNEHGWIVRSEIFRVGALNWTTMNADRIIAAARAEGMTRVIVHHNHPSGDPNPSTADHEVTAGLAEHLRKAGIVLQDHVITSGGSFYSFAAGKEIPFAEPHLAPWELLGRKELHTPPAMTDLAATMRTSDPEAVHVVYLTTKGAITAMERLPDGLSQAGMANAILKTAKAHGRLDVMISYPKETPAASVQELEGMLQKYHVGMRDASTPGIGSMQHEGLIGQGGNEAAVQTLALGQVREEKDFTGLQAVDDKGNPYAPVPLTGLADIKIIEMPELVALARDLMGQLPELRRMGKARGTFAPMGNGRIRLDPRIFSDPTSAAKTLAHEIGHLVGWLPDKVMRRGNLHGWISSLTEFMQDRYGAAAISNKEMRTELIAVTKYWKPYDAATAPKSYLSYRESAAELYADAVSVLFNSPATLKQMAPKFYAEFFRGLDTKPEAKQAFFDLQRWLNRPMMARLTDRAAAVDAMFFKAQEVFEAKWAEREERFKGFRGWLSRLKQGFFDNYAPIRDREAAAGAADAKDAARFLFDEHPLADNYSYRFLERMQRTVVAPAEAAGFSMDDIGRALFFNRIANESYAVSARMAEQLGVATGGRSVIANPQGHTPQTARLGLLQMRLANGMAGQTLLEASVQKFHDDVFEVMREANKAGLLTPDQWATIEGNRDHYATFTPLEYVDLYTPAGIFPQAGTLKEIQNPFVSTVSNTLAMLRAIQRQRLVQKTVQVLQAHFPAEIERAETVRGAGGREIPRPARAKGTQQIMLREAGKPAWYNVPAEIAHMFETVHIPLLESAVNTLLSGPFRKTFYPLFISLNPVFQLITHPTRNMRRIAVNATGLGFNALRNWSLLSRVGDNPVHDAVKRFVTQGTQDPLIAKMLDNLAITPGDPMFHATVVRPVNTFDRMMEKFGLLPPAEQSRWNPQAWPMVGPIFHAIETVGRINELTPKAAVFQIMTDKLKWTPQEAAFYVRNYVGTPNYNRRGKHIGLANAFLPFINVWMQGWAADIALATKGYKRGDRPDAPGQSPAGWWMRWALTSGIWTVLKAAAVVGLLGAGLKRVFDGIPEHQKTNYDIVPLGRIGTSDYDPEGKVAFVRLAKDPTDRLVAGMLYNLMVSAGGFAAKQGLFGDELKAANGNLDTSVFAQRGLSAPAGDTPGLNPLLKIGGAWAAYLQGQNPIDSYRQSGVLTDRQFVAGGWDAMKGMISWTFGETGASTFISYDPKAGMTLEQVKSLPVVNGLVKVSDGGYRELQEMQQKMTEQAKARLALSLPDNAQRLATEYGTLARLGASVRTPAQEARYAELQAWHQSDYKPALDEIGSAKENGLSDAEVSGLKSRLREASTQYERKP